MGLAEQGAKKSAIATYERSDRMLEPLQGANAVRLFAQLSWYMPSYLPMNESALAFFDQVIRLARKHNLRIDLTGLSHINVAEFPTWFDEHSDKEKIEEPLHQCRQLRHSSKIVDFSTSAP